jgi:hypothetical protein
MSLSLILNPATQESPWSNLYANTITANSIIAASGSVGFGITGATGVTGPTGTLAFTGIIQAQSGIFSYISITGVNSYILNSYSGNILNLNATGITSAIITSNTGNFTSLSASSLTGTSLSSTQLLITSTGGKIVDYSTIDNSFVGLTVDRPGYYFPQGWGKNYRNALNSSSTGLCRISIVGDSIMQGLNSSNLWTTSAISLLRTNLQGIYGTGGSGFNCASNDLASFSSIPGYTFPKTLCGFTGTWNHTIKGNGPAAFSVNSSTDNDSGVFQVNGTNVTIYCVTAPNTCKMTVTIDNGTPITIGTSGANGVMGYTFTGIGAGNHSVLIQRLAGAGQAGNFVVINGVRGYNNTGVVIDNYSVIGESIGLFLSNAGQYSGAIDWSGGMYTPCDLAVWALGVNDSGNQASALPTADACMTGIMSYINAVCGSTGSGISTNGNTDILFLMPYIGNYQVQSSVNYGLILERLYGLCRFYGAALINIGPLLKNSWAYASSQSFWGTNSPDGTGNIGNNVIHPSDIGSSILANFLIPYFNGSYRTGN